MLVILPYNTIMNTYIFQMFDILFKPEYKANTSFSLCSGGKKNS